MGLKNAGATCYMNAVLQQLFSILPIRNAVLSAPVLGTLQKAGVNAAALYSAISLSPPPVSLKFVFLIRNISHNPEVIFPQKFTFF